jgi:hypothetical protein
MSEKEAIDLVLYILDWLKYRHEDIFERMLDDIPSAAVILSGRSAAEKKLEELQRNEASNG